MRTFYKTKDPLGCCSNFSRHPVTIYDRTWPTSEHAFQAMKFHPHRPDAVQRVFEAATPREAADLGRDRTIGIRVDWDERPGNHYGDDIAGRVLRVEPREDGLPRVAEPLFARTKDVFMFEVCLAKFEQHPEILKELLATGDEALIEDTTSTNDAYWGWGANRLGENKLGRILMLVRDVLRH